jgi:hypothetical protein
MRCNDFDLLIDEMLSGVLYPDAGQHLLQCERCTSHYRARAVAQNALRALAAATPSGPSRATDRAVMESYRRLQQGRVLTPHAAPIARMFSHPGRRGLVSLWTSRTLTSRTLASRTWWSGAAAAVIVVGLLGTAAHLRYGVSTVNAPIATTTPATAPGMVSAASQPASDARQVLGVESPAARIVANLASPRSSQQQPSRSLSALPSSTAHSSVDAAAQLASAVASVRPAIAYSGGANYESAPVTQLSASVPSVIHLASTGVTTGNMAQSASSTWPGYSNLMYCDPVVCSGPMQVVHIKVPVGQVKPNLGQTVGNTFVNADVVVGPDGVARAIRVAN